MLQQMNRKGQTLPRPWAPGYDQDIEQRPMDVMIPSSFSWKKGLPRAAGLSLYSQTSDQPDVARRDVM
jgi:hypothetical protein